MSRMLDALKTLESKRAPAPPARVAPPAIEPRDVIHEKPAEPVAAAIELPTEPARAPFLVLDELPAVLPAPQRPVDLPSMQADLVRLPTVAQVQEPFLELAARVSDQLAANYCNVLLFVTPDPWSESSFSMVHLAQAFALQCPGEILLVDGDLRARKLSKTICAPSAGIIEVMLGSAQWPAVIHATNTQRIDFVASGTGHVPTFERPHFGWGALRPLYRAVLIGLASAEEPETEWLAERCDGVYFVLSRPHTKRALAARGVNALRSGGANVLGCVVAND